MASQIYVGQVKSWNPEKGWGHIECADTNKLYGKDVFLLRSALSSTNVSKGEGVAFTVVDNGRGPEAQSAWSLLNFPGGTGASVFPNGAGTSGGGAAAPGTYVGTVKSWNPVKGWGHITCQQTQDVYGKDMFFMKSQVTGDVAKGLTVTFSVGQGTKGPEAAGVRVLQAAPMNHAHAPMMFGAADMRVAAKQGGGKTYYGTVKVFMEDKGWGFIDCKATSVLLGKDMFFMRSSLGGTPVQVGDTVQFQVASGAKGPEANSIRVLTQELGITHAGVIKQYNEKGFGFISCDRTRSIFERDVFVHSKELGGHVPTVGEGVRFVLSIAEDGRPEATQVQFGYGFEPQAAVQQQQRGQMQQMRARPY